MLLAGVLAVAGCSAVGLGGKSVRVEVDATADCNSCGRPSGYPLTYRVLQVTDPSAVTGMTLTQLWDHEDKLLGPALLDRREAYVDPGRSSVLPVERKPGVTAVIVVGDFCESHGSCWFYVQPLSRGSHIKLQAGAECFSVTR